MPQQGASLERELLVARQTLQQASLAASAQARSEQLASGSRDYVNYFREKEGDEGATFGRLFEGYPKRVLMVHPGKLQRQRTEMLNRTKMKQLLQ